ncbi:MAG: dephospho-CoA kinase [Erysipelotrichaceae bacterium]|nr:dephospho-CoA kinase [Erysipelotrichaceae bacterium]
MKIAITGSIGSGKSTVSEYLRDKGYHVFDCDAYNALLLKRGNEGYKRVRESFPEAFAGTKPDKKKLSDIIFRDPDKKAELEAILHPLIIEEMLKESKEYDPFFAEVPLLFECDLEGLFDRNLLIVCDEDIAIERLIKRGLSEGEARRRINSQMSVEKKIYRADEIIYNNGNLWDLYKETDKWLRQYAG